MAYLLASMTPSLAISVVPLTPIPCQQPAHAHDQIAAGSAVHSHGVAKHGHCDDQDEPGDRHAACCGSVLCFSAVSPQAPGIAEFVPPHSRCEAQPDAIGDEGAFRRHYRPPIA
ncbi:MULTISPECIES: hypothetical protein [Bradyrhizobium]|uniref:hypothetical protein n=1 Tax=Bradyrhizobium TaxID=374 RepID=UPI001CD803E3|nr:MULTISPECIES: hypothetical protein [Bradyrhizobium]MCA1384698.1 hypothetical protein [Bradyrhizobium sp. BRP05]MCA1421428.1 hypothetical protein [Bradyrhizobium sp. BRP23]MCA1525608.1 hypothetical protein [Bradyrhizobium yuanmingense]